MATASENNVVDPIVQTKPLEIGNRFTWEDIATQMKALGIQQQHLSPEDTRELLNARRTGLLTLQQSDQYGTVTPVVARIFVIETPGAGPKVELIPKQLEVSPAPRYLGYQLSQEDQLRLMKTGEMGKAVPLVDKEDGKRFMGFIGIDPETKKMTVVRQERFVVPTVLRGVPITEKQQAILKDHGIIRVKGMNGVDGKPFTADVQFKTNKRGLGFTAVNQAALDALQEKRAVQNNAPQLVNTTKQEARLLADDTWKKTVVTTQNEKGERVRKPAEQLTYQDKIRVNTPKDGPAVYASLTNTYYGQELRSPRAQAKQEIFDYRAERIGKILPAKYVATPAQIQKAEQKFSVIDTIAAQKAALQPLSKPATINSPKTEVASTANQKEKINPAEGPQKAESLKTGTANPVPAVEKSAKMAAPEKNDPPAQKSSRRL